MVSKYLKLVRSRKKTDQKILENLPTFSYTLHKTVDFNSKCEQFHSFLRICSHLTKKLLHIQDYWPISRLYL